MNADFLISVVPQTALAVRGSQYAGTGFDSWIGNFVFVLFCLAMARFHVHPLWGLLRLCFVHSFRPRAMALATLLVLVFVAASVCKVVWACVFVLDLPLPLACALSVLY